VADPKEQKSESEGAGAPGGSNKMMMGLLGLNMVVMVAVALVLFLGQKKQASQQTLDQVAAGAAAEHGGGHAPAAAEGGHGAPAAGGHGEAAEASAVPQARFFPVGDFTANLAGPASTSYVKVTVNFEISNDADEEEMKQRKPQFRDKIISLLNSKKSLDLQSADGRNYLKEEIKTVANTFVKKGKVEGVYFSAFVIN
jgi:flagellar FliL protein